jgi:hypothetical protein
MTYQDGRKLSNDKCEGTDIGHFNFGILFGIRNSDLEIMSFL